MVLTVSDPSSGATATIPLASTAGGDRLVARVNDEPITVNDLRGAIANIHQDSPAGQAPMIDLQEVLQRLINVELIVQEARTIGLDEIPELRGNIDAFSEVTLRNVMREEVFKDVTVSDAEIEKRYHEDVEEVRTTTAFFEKKEKAEQALKAVKKGKSFDAVIAQGKKAGTVKEVEAGAFTKVRDLDRGIAAALKTMKVGSLSPATKIVLGGNKTYFAVFRFDEQRLAESPEAREQARMTVLETKKREALGTFNADLYAKYAKTNTQLLDSLDYTPQGPGLEKLLEDQRAVVEIAGEQPVTVAQLSAAMQEKFFHGMKRLKGDKMVETKRRALEELVQKRLLSQEALRRGLDKSEAYLGVVEEYERDALFGVFIQKVVVPGVKMTEEDLRAYYGNHAAEYSTPVAMRVRNLVFVQKADAVSALDKLKKGADFTWIKTNAEGQATDVSGEEVTFEDRIVSVDTLPADVQKTLAGAQPGEFRLYESTRATYHILYVKDVIPSRQQEFEQVREQIRPEVFRIKLNEGIAEWTRKLKASADVKVYLVHSAH
jgi:parvulin-like peptidyl-prolyl isomerase